MYIPFPLLVLWAVATWWLVLSRTHARVKLEELSKSLCERERIRMSEHAVYQELEEFDILESE